MEFQKSLSSFQRWVTADTSVGFYLCERKTED